MSRKTMRHTLITGAAVIALTSALALPARAGPIHNCGDLVKVGAGVYNVTSRGVPCTTARSFVRRASRKCGNCHYHGYTCKSRKLGSELYDTRCVNGDRVIRWQSGS